MQQDPEDADPTTHREPSDDVEAHNWAGKPPVVDDVEAHGLRPIEPADDSEDVETQA
jgi:hypothetical protein